MIVQLVCLVHKNVALNLPIKSKMPKIARKTCKNVKGWSLTENFSKIES